MVLTVEPGLYIPAGSRGVSRKWWDIGVRIEDDVLVTQTGCEVLTADLVKEVDEIEALMAGQDASLVRAVKKKAARKKVTRAGKKKAVKKKQVRKRA